MWQNTKSLSGLLGISSWGWLSILSRSMSLKGMPTLEMMMVMTLRQLLATGQGRGTTNNAPAVQTHTHTHTDILSPVFFFFFSFSIILRTLYFIWDIGLYFLYFFAFTLGHVLLLQLMRILDMYASYTILLFLFFSSLIHENLSLNSS